MGSKIEGSVGCLDAPKMRPETLRIIGHDTKHKRGEHPLYDRQVLDLDPRKLRYLINSIKKYGVKQPVMVQRDGEFIDIVEGRKRVFCCRIANDELGTTGTKAAWPVPVLLQSGTENEMALMAVMMNEQRFQRTTLERADAAQGMRDRSFDEETIAQTFMVNAATLTKWKHLLELDEECLNAVRDGRVKPSHVLPFHGLTRAEQRANLHALLESGTAPTAAQAKAQRDLNDDNDPEAPHDGDGEGSRGTARPGGAKVQTAFKPPSQPLRRDILAMCVGGAEIRDKPEDILRWTLGLADAPPDIAGIIGQLKTAKPGSVIAEVVSAAKPAPPAKAAKPAKPAKLGKAEAAAAAAAPEGDDAR
jgi:ParB/RepB/Spo0J family partition protein